MKYLYITLFLTLLFNGSVQPQNYKILHSDDMGIKISVNFENSYQIRDTLISNVKFQLIKGKKFSLRSPGEPWLPSIQLSVAVPEDAIPKIKIESHNSITLPNKFIIPFPKEDPNFNKNQVINTDNSIYNKNALFPLLSCSIDDDYIMRFIRVININISPYQFNPVTRELIFNKSMILSVSFNSLSKKTLNKTISDSFTREFINSSLINPEMGQNFIYKSNGNKNNKQTNNWYDPNKNYYKIFVRNKDVYRITFDELINAGVPIGGGVSLNEIALYNNGEAVPIDIHDDGDGIFNHGDYFQFVGFPPSPTPYCYMNIYNNSNVYWFSYQSNDSKTFKDIDGTPTNSVRTLQTTLETVHLEKDSIYERLGYAPDDHRDFWFWGTASVQNGQGTGWENRFNSDVLPGFSSDSSKLTIRINMQGITATPCPDEHTAEIFLTGQSIGSVTWDDQNTATFEKNFLVSNNSLRIYPSGNLLQVFVHGNYCTSYSDDIRINWYELEYWKNLRIDSGATFFHYKVPVTLNGINRYWLWNWDKSNMMIYIPQKGEIVRNPVISNDSYKSVFFQDSIGIQTEYFCVDSAYFSQVDSIRPVVSSNLNSITNGADYIIITHPKFLSVAQRLANIRASNFSDTSIVNPRIKIVDINSIYNEYSYGLLDPFAPKYFIKYAFENWQTPAPLYVVLLGDMSWDYRHILQDSRDNYIPSIPYQSYEFGQAVSDNAYVAVEGNDVTPDLCIGRLSCETVEEGNILLDKLESYPADNSKDWKQNVLLMASGLSADDENSFGFNDASVALENDYSKPYGMTSTKVFHYPNKPEYLQYQGGGPEIRAAIDNGAVIANYYGHGGGYQWDLVFLNDDIYMLNNGGRLPFISSVTCYTAHFDNQDIFGEQFEKVPNKGCIGFLGSSGLTLWGIGTIINQLLFADIFQHKDFITGKAILEAKSQISSSGLNASQISLLTYLGDPVLKLAIPELPDFAIKSSDISINPINPIVGDSVDVKIHIRNYGTIFTNDSVTVQLFASSSDTSYLVDVKKLPSFAVEDYIDFFWKPKSGGLFELKGKVNEINTIAEADHSDNIAVATSAVFNLNEPSIIKPIDGFTSKNYIDFLISDLGYYVNKNFQYYFEIDTSLSFTNPVKSNPVTPAEGLVKWRSPVLNNGVYFWRTRIADETGTLGKFSGIRSFTIADSSSKGYTAKDKILETFNIYNMNYSDQNKSLSLNTQLLPPRPSNTKLIDSIFVNSNVTDSVNLTTITTDGKYLYFGNIWYFALNHNTNGYSKIYKVGTGNNGTTKGQFYDAIPNFNGKILNQIFYHSDGFIYVSIGESHRLLKINPINGDTSSVYLNNGILRLNDSRPIDGAAYLTSDGQYVYNLTLQDSLGAAKYVLRIFDPLNNWVLVRPDMELSGSSNNGFSGFFVSKGYIYPVEYVNSNLIRRIRISDGFFEEEWIAYQPFKSLYSWCYDWTNDNVYASVYRSDTTYKPKFEKFAGSYVDANGYFETPQIGPALTWNKITYNVENSSTKGKYTALLKGLNKNTKNWDTLVSNLPNSYSLGNINPSTYQYLKTFFSFTDSSFGIVNPMKFNNINISYETLPEINLTKSNFIFNPDTVLQGLNSSFNIKIDNLGDSDADSLSLKFYLDNQDSVYLLKKMNVPKDSSNSFSQPIPTANLSPATFHKIKVIGVLPSPEYFTFNNLTENGFYVSRDSSNPIFNITFDGKEINNDDIISAKPVILITMKDNSPLPIDTTSFTTLTFDNVQLSFTNPDLKFSYTPYPNSEATIKWTPTIQDGKHVLEVLAKDPSGNFFDSVSHKYEFFVYNQPDLINVFNYPNPFKNDTYFTFEIHGQNAPQELRIKVFTVAGRLIKDISIPPSDLQVGFNKIYWNGRDQDGDEIANGVYFYKIIAKNDGVVKTTTEKLAKIK